MIYRVTAHSVIIINLFFNKLVYNIDRQINFVVAEVGQDIGRALLVYFVEHRCFNAMRVQERTCFSCGI